MLGSRFFTFFTAALAGSTIVSAMAISPVEARSEAIAVRQDAEIESILDQLSGNIDSPLAGLQSLFDSGDITEAKAAPYFNELTGHINSATTALQSVSPAARLKARSGKDVIGEKCANIIIKIFVIFKLNLLLILVPILGKLIITLDIAIHGLLKVVEGLLAGVLIIVAKLLVSVVAILIGLGCTQILVILGLSL